MPVLTPVVPTPPAVIREGQLPIVPGAEISNPTHSALKVGESHLSTHGVPIVSLDVDTITDAMVARLATSLIGHVLFLKSQIPLPIKQLSRMSTTKSTARATKQRNELLSSFDTLTSHLNTTFTALSSAFARATATSSIESGNAQAGPTHTRAYLAILVGPSTTSAKSKVIYAVNGLETKAIGSRDDAPKISEDDEDEDSLDGDSEEEDERSNEDGEGGDSDESDPEDDDVQSDEEESDDAHSPPESRTPSPEPMSHADQQRALQAAERLLSKTLAAADAEEKGMSSDLAPTQTHVLLRAPRRFIHPAWIPRQNLTASLENTLHEFLELSGLEAPSSQVNSTHKTKSKKGQIVEGVWVTAKGGLGTNQTEGTQNGEWDEMIWWSWDGKISGFSEW